MKQIASVFCYLYAMVYFKMAIDGNDFFISVVFGITLAVLGYWFWPKSHNSLIQFGYSFDLLDNPDELQYLKAEMPNKPKFKLWIGEKYVFAFNNPILINGKAGVAKLHQFSRKELTLIEAQKEFIYHSYDDKGIWFLMITDSKSKRTRRKPYPFQ